MISIAGEVEQDPEIVLTAPHMTRTSRVDEVSAARKPVLRWTPGKKTDPRATAADLVAAGNGRRD
jgi:glycine cleavage system protein P-like pyridoxal-binding family